VAVIKLACPCCAGDGDWTVRGYGETWTDPAGRPVAVVTGVTGCCGSRVLLDPSLDAVEKIREREEGRRAMAASARAALERVAGDG
jgi:hypothetical protein